MTSARELSPNLGDGWDERIALGRCDAENPNHRRLRPRGGNAKSFPNLLLQRGRPVLAQLGSEVLHCSKLTFGHGSALMIAGWWQFQHDGSSERMPLAPHVAKGHGVRR